MRAIALHADVLVATSAIWQTNCTVVRGASADGTGADGAGGGEEAESAPGEGEVFVIDSPILPDELEALPALLKQVGFPTPSGLLATHGDWDHLLGRLAFPALALGCAENTAARMYAAPGAAQRELRAFDEAHFIERDQPLALGAVQALPIPGNCGIGERELALYPASGHTGDGIAILIDWAGVLLVGDYLSPVELPVLGPTGDAQAYADTLLRLRPLVERVEHVVPGHGRALNRDRALEILAEDLADVQAGRASSATRLRRSARPPRSVTPS